MLIFWMETHGTGAAGSSGWQWLLLRCPRGDHCAADTSPPA
ncbi:MAG: hypothetical protein ACLTYN_15680 [Dysosmobacter welbionis]